MPVDGTGLLKGGQRMPKILDGERNCTQCIGQQINVVLNWLDELT